MVFWVGICKILDTVPEFPLPRDRRVRRSSLLSLMEEVVAMGDDDAKLSTCGSRGDDVADLVGEIDEITVCLFLGTLVCRLEVR